MALAGEDRLLRWLRALLGESRLGDDAALLPAAAYAATVDSQIEGVHFVPGLDPALLARRLLAVNLSDLAAMGADPAFGLLALATPPGFDHRRFFRAFKAACHAWGVELAGGDLARGPLLVATLTLLGRKPENGRWLRRDGARPGHAVWLGGTVGESAAGQRLVAAGARLFGGRVELPPAWPRDRNPRSRAARRAVRRHLLPEPQLGLGAWLRQQPEGGAIDLSDGLARDLHRLCRESRAGAEIDYATLPRPAGFVTLCRELGEDPDELALHGGEDYVLLFTLPEAIAVPDRFGCHRIGGMHRSSTVRLRRGAAVRELADRGFDHLENAGRK